MPHPSIVGADEIFIDSGAKSAIFRKNQHIGVRHSREILELKLKYQSRLLAGI